jgi:ABC-2 type transport system ATP-binding protein
MDLSGHSGTLIGQLSRGYRQRVGLAQALMNEPDFLILDEPTSGLDPLQVEHTRRLVRELGARSIVVLSTHLLHDVHEICSRVLVLRDGELAGELPVIRDPQTGVADLLRRYAELQQVTYHSDRTPTHSPPRE